MTMRAYSMLSSAAAAAESIHAHILKLRPYCCSKVVHDVLLCLLRRFLEPGSYNYDSLICIAIVHMHRPFLVSNLVAAHDPPVSPAIYETSTNKLVHNACKTAVSNVLGECIYIQERDLPTTQWL